MTFNNLSSHQDKQVTALYDAPTPAIVVEIIEELDKKLTAANERIAELESQVEEAKSDARERDERSDT